MKKIAILTMTALLLLGMAGCSAKEEQTEPVATTEATVAPTAEETTIPAPTEPEWEEGIARAAQAEALRKTFDQGTQVQVLGQYGDYYVVEGQEEDLLVEKRFLRLDSEESPEEETRYAKWNALVFDNVYFRGEPIATLNTNTKLTILEGKDSWYQISWADGEGYVKADQTNKYRYTSGSGNSDGGSSGGGSTGGSSGGSRDGTDVDLGQLRFNGGVSVTLLGAYYGPEQEPDFTPGQGKILAEDVEGYLLLWNRGDSLKVTEHDETSCTIWVEEELYVTLPRYLVTLEGDEAYESWTGYSRSQAVVYQEYQMRNESKKLRINQEVTVLDELAEQCYSYFYPGCYVVEVDGEIGYMSANDVRPNRFATSSPSTGEESYGGGGSGSTGGGGSSSGDTWTPPVL